MKMNLDKSKQVLAAPLSRRAAFGITALGMAAALLPSPSAIASEKPQASGTVGIEAPRVELAYEALVTISPAVEIGVCPQGTRRYIPITGGSFQGSRITGTILPGGADWQLQRADGVTEIDALYSMKTDDGAVIIVRNRGLISRGGKYFRTVPRFEAPNGPHDWLNQSVFVGTVAGAPQPGTVMVRVFEVL